uniref:Putative ovule protein n=1 Tax=Solanum chacoense TaxID=4108 RepID=A0A0V0HMY9_SOLCH
MCMTTHFGLSTCTLASKQAQGVLIIILLKLYISINLELIRYVNAGAAWLNGAFSKVAKAGQVAGTKTREKWNFALSNLTAKDPSIVA